MCDTTSALLDLLFSFNKIIRKGYVQKIRSTLSLSTGSVQSTGTMTKCRNAEQLVLKCEKREKISI